jgi:inositol transport system substrate-binding protein
MARILAVLVALFWAAPSLAKTTIGVSMAYFDDNFLTILRLAMADEAKRMGDVTIQFQDAQGDIGRQINQVQNFVAQKVGAIIVNPADTSATARITKMASDAGIPLVYVNRKPDEAKLPPKVVFVGSDELVAGRLQAEELAKRLGGEGSVAIMLGELASNGTRGRTEGVKEVLKKYPGIKVVQEQTANFQRNQAIDLMNNWIVSGVKMDAVAANNDEMALGALIAMKQAGISPEKIHVGGVDATPDALQAIADGSLAVTVFQDAKGQGSGAVQAAVKLAKGEKVEQTVWIPFRLVTKANYKQYATN